MRIPAVLVALICSLVFSAAVGAQTLEDSGQDAEVSALQYQAQEQDALLGRKMSQVASVGSELEDAQAEASVSQSRAEALASQARELEADLSTRRKAYKETKTRYEEQARAAYRGEDVDALVSVLGAMFGTGQETGDFADIRDAEALLRGREDLRNYQESRQMVRNTARQVGHKRAEYKDAQEERQAKTKELQSREERLESSISRIKGGQTRTDNRIQQLQQEERNRILKTSPATGGTTVQNSRESRVAKRDIVVRRVEPISKKRYMKLYKESARKYGFKE